MIPASDDFIAQESNPDTGDPVFFFTFLPHYFATGVAAGSGTFVNVSYVDPGRLQVDGEAALASWTSPALQARVGEFPASFTPTWQLDYPGFDVAIEYRTGESAAALAAAAWQTMTIGDPVSSYRYYQWRISWVGIRSWAYDTVEEAEASANSAWALDAADPEDPYESYAQDSAYGDLTFIEHVRFTGIFEIDQADIKDPGVCVDECPLSLGDLVAGSHTLTLGNREFRYSPRHANFIFAEEENWKRKNLLIKMAYRLPSGVLTDRITIYEGIIDDWGPAPHQAEVDGKLQEHAVPVVTRDLIAELLRLKVGTPDADGNPTPLVFGTVFRQLDQLADETLGDPDAESDFESNTTEDLTGVDSANGGVVAVASEIPINGDYYLHTEVANANALAKGRMNLAAAGAEVLFTSEVRFAAIPETPSDKNVHFMGLFDSGGNEILQLFVGSDFRVHAYAGAQWKETDWYINQDVAVVKRVSIGVLGANPGTIKVWVNGNEVLCWDEDWSSLSIKGGFIGPHNGAVAEAWNIDSDDWGIFPNWWPQLYKVPGGPYEEIGTIYVDGATKVGAEPLYSDLNRRGLRYGPAGVPTRFVGGVTKTANVEKYPGYGAVAFTDYANQVSGTVMAYLRKDSTTHWVDIVRGVLTAQGKEGWLDETAAAAAKAATPDDTVGAFFENITMGDAIMALAATCLFDAFRSQNLLKLQAYTGIAPVTYELELTEANSRGVAPQNDDKDIKNQVFIKWGPYDRNHRLSRTVKDDLSISYVGVYDTEIDLAAGGIVETDNGPMAIQKAETLLKRLVGGRLVCDPTISTLQAARLEVGDEVRINMTDYGTPEILQVKRKAINLFAPKGVELFLNKNLGEIAA